MRTIPPRRHPEVRWLAVVLAALAGLLLADCSRRQADPSGFLRVRLRHDPPTLDPALSHDSSSEAVLAPLFEPLVRADPATLEIRPALAQRWEVSPDGRTYTFHLREGALFHHGRAVEAADVVYSLLRLLRYDRPSPGAELLDPVLGAKDFGAAHEKRLPGLEAIDSHTVRIRLMQPYSPFLSRLTAVHASIVPRDRYEDPDENYLRGPIGSGPFKFVEWKSAQSLKLARFEEYRPGPPALAGIEFRIVEDPAAALEEYRRGGLDILDELPPGAGASAAGEFGDEYKIWPLLGGNNLVFNLAAPPLAGNVNLRRALNLAVDRQRICEQVFSGLPRPSSGILPQGMPGFDGSRPPYGEDLAAARRLLAQAGFPEGKGLPPLVLLFNTNPNIQRLAEQVQIDLARIGVRLELRSADGPAFLQSLASGQFGGRPFHMIRLGWAADYPDPDAFLGTLLHSRNAGMAGNFARYRDKGVDALIDEARRTLDASRRTRIYRDIEKLAADRDACWLFLTFQRDEALIAKHVRGVVPVVRGDWFLPYDRLSLAP